MTMKKELQKILQPHKSWHSTITEKANLNDRFTFSEEFEFQGTKEDCNSIEVQSRAATSPIIDGVNSRTR
jgi:hypothetical protein